MASTAESANEYLRQELACVVAPPPTADHLRSEYYSRQCARLGERVRAERRRAHEWRGRTGYATGAAIFLLGAYSASDWILAAGVFLVAATVAIQNGRDWR